MKLIRKIAEGIFGKNDLKSLREDISHVEVVSFDVFDTLILRSVSSPEKIFEVMQHRADIEGKYGIKDFTKVRLTAEKLARKRIAKEEITLEDIYKYVDGISDDDRNSIMQIEIDTEICLSQANPAMRSIFDDAVNAGKKILIVSDMYLSTDVIKRILCKNGYENYDRVYVSSEYLKTKRSGRLFEQIIENYPVTQNKILHVGDHLLSDFIVPKRYGINSFLYHKKSQKLFFFRCTRSQLKNNYQYDILKTILKNNIQNDDLNYRVGYEVVCPLLFGYVMWLYENVQKDDIDKICFLAREGKILKEAYEIMFPDATDNCYLYVSRKALCRASICRTTSYNEFIKLLYPSIKELFKVEEVFDLLRIDEKGKAEAEKRGFLMRDNFDDIKDKKGFWEILQTVGGEHFLMQNQLFQNYLQQMDVNKNKKIIFSDIGWSGTMQLCVSKFFGIKSIKGYYLGVSDYHLEGEYRNLQRIGYLFTPEENLDMAMMTRFSITVFELLLSNSEGTTEGYLCNDKNTVIPEIRESEYGVEEKRKLEYMQKCALQLLKIFKTALLGLGITFDPEVLFEGYKSFAVYPSGKSLLFFNDIRTLYTSKTIKILPEKSIIYYLLHPVSFMREFNGSNSRVIWLKGLLKIKLPYYSVLKFLALNTSIKSEYRRRMPKAEE